MLRKIDINAISISVLCFAIIAIALALPNIYQASSFVQADADSYINAAKLLYLNNKVDTVRPVGIAAYIGLPLLFIKSFTAFTTWAFVANIVLWVLCCIMVYRLVLYYTNSSIATIALLLCSTNISLIVYSCQSLSELLFTTSILTVVYFLHKYGISKMVQHFATVILFLAVATCVKPMLWWPFWFVLLVVLFKYVYSKSLKNVVVLFVAGILMFTYGYCFYTKYNTFNISTIGYAAFSNYINIKTKQLLHNSTYEQEINLMYSATQNMDAAAKRNFTKQETKNILQNHTATFVQAYISNWWSNSTTGNANLHVLQKDTTKTWYTIIHKICFAISLLQNVITSLGTWLLCIAILFYRKRFNPPVFKYLLILLGACLYIQLISALCFYQHDRFHIVTVPFFIVALSIFLKRKVNLL